MKNTPTCQAARQVYTLCYRITGCPQAARQVALEALTDPRPLRKAVALCVARAPALDGAAARAGGSRLERALFSLPWGQRLALVLLDQLGLAPDEAARWTQLPQIELTRLCYAGRLALAKATA